MDRFNGFNSNRILMFFFVRKKISCVQLLMLLFEVLSFLKYVSIILLRFVIVDGDKLGQ